MNMKKYYLLLTQVVVLAFVGITSASAQSQFSPYISKVYEYVPAPGQFINTLPEWEVGDDAQAMADKCTELLAGEDASMICLGGFGGYVTFGFDHPVVNRAGEYDLYIKGNAFAATGMTDTGSSEPGIVMVSRDANNNGLPDDEWYELSGSADVDSVGKVVYNYEITYKFLGDKKPITWTDNQGGRGVVPRNDFHTQEYFPAWLTGEGSLTLSGTLLPKNAYLSDGTYYLRFLRYGYVDNQPNLIDGKKNEACCFNLDWAVDKDRKPVSLTQIDFVRVYSAMNQLAGILGETSTEFAGAEDLHPEAEPTGIESLTPIPFPFPVEGQGSSYNLSGQKVGKGYRGIVVNNGTLILR